MIIHLDKKTRVLCQGITGTSGLFHAKSCREYGTQMVGGVAPGAGGTKVEGFKVFNTVEEAVQATEADASMIFVPAFIAADAILEAADAGIQLIVCMTRGIPQNDVTKVISYLKQYPRTQLLGPNSPGLIVPGKAKVGVMPGNLYNPGSIGLVSRSDTLMSEAALQLNAAGLGQSVCVGLGSEPVMGTTFVDVLDEFNRDDRTQAVLLLGKTGGRTEEEAARYIKKEMKKPVVALVAGVTAPSPRPMGHASAIILGGGEGAAEKIDALKSAGVVIAKSPVEIAEAMKEALAHGAKRAAKRPSKTKK